MTGWTAVLTGLALTTVAFAGLYIRCVGPSWRSGRLR